MDENAGPGRETRTTTVNIMFGGRWVPLGDAEVLVEEGRVVKVLSFTPKAFDSADDERSEL